MTRDPIEFDERSVPKAYLITFRCYGTWLHGDERGSVDRRYFNRFGGPKITPSLNREVYVRRQMRHGPFELGAAAREIVETAIRDVCFIREYGLYALNVRSNRVHSVTSNAAKPEFIMNSFKSYATRALRSAGLIGADTRPWSRHGSTRYLWTDEHVQMAVTYVVDGQGGELPTFD
jgi:REP element-mobilizing transposase RayT